MAARDRWDYELRCPKCGAVGRAHVSEDDHPWMRDPGFRVDEVEGQFRVKSLGRTSSATKFECNACNVEVPH